MGTGLTWINCGKVP